MNLIFSELENKRKEKRGKSKIVLLIFGSLNRPETDFSPSSVTDVLMKKRCRVYFV